MKTQRKRTVLALDDDEINLMILAKNAQDAGYEVKTFMDGEEAWHYLTRHPQSVDIALFDKMMPGLSGIDLTRRMKQNDALRHIPVIIQTGDAGVEQMREGLETGAYYYLTKPFHPEILVAVLHAAEHECRMREELLADVAADHARFFRLLHDGEFTVQSHEEARLFAASLAKVSQTPDFVALGLMELLYNAIEHGNFEIGFERKRRCLLDNSWEQEIAQRAQSPQYRHRMVRVHVTRVAEGFAVTVQDEGKGFDWQPYLFEDDGLEMQVNGRGVAKASVMLSDLRYQGNGNEVRFLVRTSVPAHVGAPTAARHFHS